MARKSFLFTEGSLKVENKEHFYIHASEYTYPVVSFRGSHLFTKYSDTNT